MPVPAYPTAMLKIFFDGGCRPNPGMMEIAVVARGVVTLRRDLGHGTSFDAEWMALIEALKVARALQPQPCVVLGDAASVVNQAVGRTPCRGAALDYLRICRSLVAPNALPHVRHIKRAQNLAGIALAAQYR